MKFFFIFWVVLLSSSILFAKGSAGVKRQNSKAQVPAYCDDLEGAPISKKKLDQYLKNGTAPAYFACHRRLKDPAKLQEVANAYRDLHVDHLNNMVALLGSIKTDLFQNESEKRFAEIDEKLRPQPKSSSKIAVGLLKDLAKEIPLMNLGKELVGPMIKWGGTFHSMYELYNSFDPSSPFYNEKNQSTTTLKGVINNLTNTIQAVKSQALSLEGLDTIKCQFAVPVPKGKVDPLAQTCKYFPEKLRGTLTCEDYVNMESFEKHKSDKNKFLSNVATNVAKEVYVEDKETGGKTTAMIELDIPINTGQPEQLLGAGLTGAFKFTGHLGETMLCQILQDPKFWQGGQLKEFVGIESLGLPMRINFRYLGADADSLGNDYRISGRMTGFAYRNMNGEIPEPLQHTSVSNEFGWKLGHADSVEVFKEREQNHLGRSGPVFRTGLPPTMKPDSKVERKFEESAYTNMEFLVKKGATREFENKIPIRKLAPKCNYQQH